MIHLVAGSLTDLSPHLHALGDPVRPYADMLSRADESKSVGLDRSAPNRPHFDVHRHGGVDGSENPDAGVGRR